ncbi:glycosyltransferase family 2 protein [Bradyrhizobium sp. LHD-71]|uniref:glycosyltransferase family 2 protein n=1 Tax=Bradyrhizobium sp. LHD-71 TaxID=3072141 RepID=UPI00280EBF15|nr:glycosyltransferase family 2 protein [Bradyrhizobium sp. LHD-71]MDQ8728378.1 glycosyltransferase family 2 protein [Bradyrhizobium sp. LHD-71]
MTCADLKADSEASSEHQASLRIAVIVPCYNEAPTIAAVVARAKAALPGAAVYVYDNNSLDDTAKIARAAGAIVANERYQGKGNVVRRMFADIDADIYVMVDGDNTYDLEVAPALIATMREQSLDFVNGARIDKRANAYRAGHRFGNRLLSDLVQWIFGHRFSDMLSGYKILSRRFVKSFPAESQGFEIETELTIHALELRMPAAEMPTIYGVRPEGSSSKLSTWRDGLRILFLISRLVKDEHPFQVFGTIAVGFALASLWLGVPVIAEFVATGLVPRFPTALLATGLMLIGVMSFSIGLVLDTVTKARREAKRLAYLAHAPVP